MAAMSAGAVSSLTPLATTRATAACHARLASSLVKSFYQNDVRNDAALPPTGPTPERAAPR